MVYEKWENLKENVITMFYSDQLNLQNNLIGLPSFCSGQICRNAVIIHST
jgi:hypothetical protein